MRYGLKGVFQGAQEYFKNIISGIPTVAEASGSETKAAVEMLRMLFSH